MKLTAIVFGFALSFSAFAGNVVLHEKIVLMDKGESVDSDATWTMQNARKQTSKNVIVNCVESLPEDYQVLSNQGLVFITENQSVNLSNTLHVCL